MLENLVAQSWLNYREFGDPKTDEENRICPSYSFRHNTTLHSQSAMQNCLVTGHCIMWQFRIWYVKYDVSIYVNNSFSRDSRLSNWAKKQQDDWSRRWQLIWQNCLLRQQLRKKIVRHSCLRPLIVFSSQLSVSLMVIFGCFWKTLLSKTCDQSTVWVGKVCTAAG